MSRYIVLVALLVGLDQFIKLMVRFFLAPGVVIKVIPHLIELTYQENKGISFGMLSSLPETYRALLLAGITMVVVIALIVYIVLRWRSLMTAERWGFSLIIAGAIGNLLDRAIRKQVTDYMHFYFFNTSFFVNNLADDLIFIGFVLLLLQSFRKKRP